MTEGTSNFTRDDAIARNVPIEFGEYQPAHPAREAVTFIGAVSLAAFGIKGLYGKLTERLRHER